MTNQRERNEQIQNPDDQEKQVNRNNKGDHDMQADKGDRNKQGGREGQQGDRNKQGGQEGQQKDKNNQNDRNKSGAKTSY